MTTRRPSLYERVRALIVPAAEVARREEARLEVIPGGKERRKVRRSDPAMPLDWHKEQHQRVLDAQHRAGNEPPDTAA